MQLEIVRISREVGITVIYVTHDQEEALAMSDRIAVYNAGRIEQFGSPREVYQRPKTLFVAGFMQSFCLTPLAAIMLRTSDESMRGRVMGVRMLAIWGLPLGLVAAGPLIERAGYAPTVFLYCALGVATTLAIGYRYRSALWHRTADANAAYGG